MAKRTITILLLFILLITSCAESSKNNNPSSSDSTIAAPTDTTSVSTDSTIVTTTDSIQQPQDTVTIKRSKIVRQTYKSGKLLRPNIKVKGIYVTGPTAGIKRMNELVELVTSTEMNAIVLDIKNDGGKVTYKMENKQAQEIGACVRYVRDMPNLLQDLHEKGIYVIGRIVCFKDATLAKGRPELALTKANGQAVTDGKGQAWVNPYRKEVWEYLCSLAEQASADGFDEIQFDYVRFPILDDTNHVDYGVNLTEYSREECLNDFFNFMQERLHKKEIIFGADLFGTVIGSDTDRDRTGQDYVDLATKADALYPMIYPSHYGPRTFGLDIPDAHPYAAIKGALSLSQKQLLPLADSIPTAIIRPWLQCFTAPWRKGHINYGSKQIRQQIQAVYDAGYEEWVLWNAANRYDYVKQALSMKASEAVDTPDAKLSNDSTASLPAPQTDSTLKK